MNDEKDLMRVDDRTQERVIESLVLRGDLSGLAPKDRARFYVQVCEGLGLNPASNPLAFLRLNGKEVLYATRTATDQLARIHRVTREVTDGPKVIDLAGTKVVYCAAKATHPSGRWETAIATLPFVDPVNVLMKAETKAKRRATISLLGLGMLDEMELETIPASVQEPGGGVDLAMLEESPADAEPASDREDSDPRLVAFYEDLAGIELPGESVAVWMKHRANLAMLPGADRETAWRHLCARTEEVGKMKNAKVWLKKAIAEEDARRTMEAEVRTAEYRVNDAADDLRESAMMAESLTALAQRWIAAKRDVAAWDDRAAQERAWGAFKARARELGATIKALQAEIARLDAPPPPDGTDGPSAPRSAANDTAGAEGSPAQSSGTDGTVARDDGGAWTLSAKGIRDHVAAITNARHLEASGRAHLREVSPTLKVHALHCYTARLRELSRREERDEEGGTVVTQTPQDVAFARVETWLREGPKDAAAPPQRRTRRAA